MAAGGGVEGGGAGRQAGGWGWWAPLVGGFALRHLQRRREREEDTVSM